MTDPTPITPPDALCAQWREEAPIYRDSGAGRENWLMNRAAQWGADQELKACCKWTAIVFPSGGANALRTARRPKPPSLKEQALEALERMDQFPTTEDKVIIRRALEALPND